MSSNLMIFLVSVILIAYFLIWKIDWDAMEERAKNKWQHTFLNDNDFEKLEEKLDEAPDEYTPHEYKKERH